MDTPWRIELLGRLRATQGDWIITRFRARRAGSLLAYLAYYLDRSHPREMLIELLWPQVEVQTGRNNLSRELNSLRRQLEPPGVPAGAVILANRDSVQLNPAACTTDVQAFETALQMAARAMSYTERAAHLTEAVELYRGDLLPGYFEDWILPERQRLVDLYLQVLAQLTVPLAAAGDYPGALQWARRAVAADPLREEGHHDLIQLLAAAGQPEAARRQYQQLQRLLAQELGVEPTPAISAFIRGLEQTAAPHPERQPRQGSRQEESQAPRPTPPLTPAGQKLPSGTVTFLLTDIVRSTALCEQSSPPFRSALPGYHELLRHEFQRHGGREVKEAAGSFVVAFGGAADALACAIAAQRALAAYAWPEEVGRLQVRMALHTADVEQEKGEYRSLVLHHAARMIVAAHGGQIIGSEVTAALLRRSSPGTLEAGVQVSELGVYRLRSVTSPERLFQVSYPGMAQPEFPPLNTLPAHEGNLPLQFTRFFGREEEIERLCQLLGACVDGLSADHPAIQNPKSIIQNRLVTLTGPGGSGKTRLALEVARRLRTAFHGAVWFVALQDLTDARLIPDKLLDALRLPRSPQAQPMEQTVDFLSRQPGLLLLDNFEHLVAEGAPRVHSLLEQVPALTCLVTSRQRLRLVGEQEFPVAPLPVPVEGPRSTVNAPAKPDPSDPSDPSDLIKLTQCPSVQLFVDRVQAIRPDFQVTVTNAWAVAGVCTRLEGIPLALELAAARAGVLSPQQMLARLEQRFELLTGGQQGAAPRHRSLRVALDWSYQLLSPELQRFFAQLSVFQGGWTLEAAEAVCGEAGVGYSVFGVGGATSARTPNTQHPTPTLDCLEQLRECSLVEAAEAGGGTAERSEVVMRFRLLETLREYGAEQLGPGERATVAHRHASYYLALAERAEPEFARADQVAWLDRLGREQDNLRAALPWLEASGRIQDALRLEGSLWHFRVARGDLAEGLERLRRLLALPGAEERTAARAKALNGAGVLAQFVREHVISCRLHEAGLAIGRELDDGWNIAFALTGLGHTLDSLGCSPGNESDLELARSLLKESLAIWHEIGDPWGVAYALNGLGWVACNQHDYGAARAHWRECLRVRREQENQWGIALTLFHLGVLAQEQKNGEEARSLWQECLAVAQELGDRYQMGQTLLCLGNLAYREGDLSTARALLEEGLPLVREAGIRYLMGQALSDLAAVAGDQGEPETASAYLEEAMGIWRLIGDRPGIAGLLHRQGRIEQQQGDLVVAGRCFAESLTLWKELADRQPVADCLEGLAAVAARQGRSERACRLFGAAAALRETGGWPLAPVYRSEYERHVAAVRDALGEGAFAVAWAEGRAMTQEEAAAYALE